MVRLIDRLDMTIAVDCDRKQQTKQTNKSKALISLHGCAGWSTPLLFANPEERFSLVKAHIIYVLIINMINLMDEKQFRS